MRVDGTQAGQTSLGLNGPNANRVNAPESAAAEQPAAAGEFQPGSDLRAFLGALDGVPLVRQEVVGEVARRLNGGELNSPQARQQTVESILGPAPGHD